jgi:hypothetical protein
MAEEDRRKLCEILRGKRLFSNLYGVYCLTLASLKTILQNSVGRETDPQSTEATDTGYQERKLKKRDITGEKSPPKLQTVTSVPTRNFFAPLNSGDMETENRMENEGKKEPSKGTGRPPPS